MEASPSTGIIDNVFDVPIYYKDEWGVGIGGGLWSTGRALSSYLASHHAESCLRALTSASKNGDGLSIIELGSGNGFLAACLVCNFISSPVGLLSTLLYFTLGSLCHSQWDKN